MAHMNRLDTRWVQRLEITMPLSGTSWMVMLHADGCQPATADDADKLRRIARGEATEADRKVVFTRYALEATQPAFDAWQEHGCKITFAVEYDDRDDKEHYASTLQHYRAKRWAAGASTGDLVRMAKFFPHVEDTSYEAEQSKAARSALSWRTVRTAENVVTSTDLARLHEIARLYGGQLGEATSAEEKKRFETGMKTLIGELLAARVFVVHDDRPRDSEGFPIDAR